MFPRLRMGRLQNLLLGLMLAGLPACRPRPARLPLKITREGDHLLLVVSARPQSWTHLVYGLSWRGEDPLHPLAPGAFFRLVKGDGSGFGYHSLLKGPLPANGPHTLRLPVFRVPQGRGVLQVVATATKDEHLGPFLGISRAYLVEHEGRRLELARPAARFLRRYGPSLLFQWGLLVCGLLFLWRWPLPCLKGGRVGLVLILLVACLLLAVRVRARGTLGEIESGQGFVPFLWPVGRPRWRQSFGEALGPGFQELLDRASRESSRRRLPLFIRDPARQGQAMRRAVVASYLLPKSQLLSQDVIQGPGLLLAFGGESRGQSLFATRVGSLSLLLRERGR